MRTNRRRFLLLPTEAEHKHSPRGTSPKASPAEMPGRPAPSSDAVDAAAGAVVAILSVAVIGVLPSRVAMSGVTAHAAPCGTPAHRVATAPVSPLTGVRVTCVLKVAPARISEDDC